MSELDGLVDELDAVLATAERFQLDERTTAALLGLWMIGRRSQRPSRA